VSNHNPLLNLLGWLLIGGIISDENHTVIPRAILK